MLSQSASGFFGLFQPEAAFFVVQRVCIAYRRRGWPATDGAGVLADRQKQGGVRGVFRSMQFPAVGLVVIYYPVPVGIASL